MRDRLARRARTEAHIELIREEIRELKMPHVPVRKIYINLISNKGCSFTYQYFIKLVESNWNTMIDEDGKRYLIVSSENNALCGW